MKTPERDVGVANSLSGALNSTADSMEALAESVRLGEEICARLVGYQPKVLEADGAGTNEAVPSVPSLTEVANLQARGLSMMTRRLRQVMELINTAVN